MVRYSPHQPERPDTYSIELTRKGECLQVTDQAINSLFQIIGTFVGGILAAGSAIYSQHLTSYAHKAKMAELEYQAEARRKRIQTRTLFLIQEQAHAFVGLILMLWTMRLAVRAGRNPDDPMKSYTERAESSASCRC